MKTMMDRLQVEDDKLNLELEESHGDYENMRLIFDEKIGMILASPEAIVGSVFSRGPEALKFSLFWLAQFFRKNAE